MIAQFALRLLAGMSLMWLLMPRDQVTAGFFRIQMLVALGLSVLSGLSLGHLTEQTDGDVLLEKKLALAGIVVLGGTAFVGSVLWTLARRQSGAVCVWILAVLTPLILLGSLLSTSDFQSSRGILILLSELATAGVLGGTVTAMLLGHWYLTAPTMSMTPLSRLNGYLGGAVLLRLLVSGLCLALGFELLSSPTHQIWLVLRWGAGILGPAAVVLMVWRILRYRNTQSATGVLFTGVILSFIGEMMGSLLFWELRFPF